MRRLYDGLVTAEKVVAGALLVGTFVILIFQVFTRYVLSNPLAWSEELARFMLVWLAFVAAAYVMSQRLHITVDVVVAKLPKRAARAVDVVSQLLVAVAAGALTWAGVHFAAATSDQAAPATGLPMSVVYSAAMVGFGLIALHGVVNLVRDFTHPEEVRGAMEGLEDVA